MFGSSRSGGVRGGQDQFNWDDVKVDKHRENYLGKSVLTANQEHGFAIATNRDINEIQYSMV